MNEVAGPARRRKARALDVLGREYLASLLAPDGRRARRLVEDGLGLTGGEPVGAGRVAIVASTPGERHALGGQMVADFLEAQAWTVLALGADTPAPELIELARDRGAEVVALSTALPGHLLSVTLTCELLRRLPRPPYIVVGGRAYGGDLTRALAVGADAFAGDPQTLLTLLADRFAPHAAH